jgi:hypothetical protein
MKNWQGVLRAGLPLILAAGILSGCVVSPDPVYVSPRPYYYHPYYYHPYYHGYYGHGYYGHGYYGWGRHW